MSLIKIRRLAINPDLIAYIVEGQTNFQYFLMREQEELVPVEDGEAAIFLMPTMGGVLRSRDPEDVAAIRTLIAGLPDAPVPIIEAAGPVPLTRSRPNQSPAVEQA